jgi:hypothetical protein
MGTAAVSLGAAFAGLIIGYLFRLTEFRRERRLVAYADFVASFLTAAHAGAALFSAGIQQGEAFFSEENRELGSDLWETFGRAAERFEAATACLRLVGSDSARVDSEVLEDFITENIRKVPPLAREAKLSDAGRAAQAANRRANKGPAQRTWDSGRVFLHRGGGRQTRGSAITCFASTRS